MGQLILPEVFPDGRMHSLNKSPYATLHLACPSRKPSLADTVQAQAHNMHYEDKTLQACSSAYHSPSSRLCFKGRRAQRDARLVPGTLPCIITANSAVNQADIVPDLVIRNAVLELRLRSSG